ncbi:MAG: TetR/AcrR family transcriptional regulator [Cyclobacteriaceae bacterium]|nr:TetR/AcrR family transcriptional regulator [Cyclobacteriaceae bacterium]
MGHLTFKLNEKLYVRDPQSTELGQKIVSKGIEMIDGLGFEQFTFKKLAAQVNSTEPSIYRYFENKHRLLHYLTAWYWSWLDYRLDLATASLHSPEEKLRASIRVITEEKKTDPSFQHVNEEALHRIVVNELEKTYLTKWVDDDNQAGLFGGFKTLTKKISGFIKEVAPDYPFPNSLVSTILLAANEQLFFLEHLPTLSNLDKRLPAPQRHAQLQVFIESLVFGAIQKK